MGERNYSPSDRTKYRHSQDYPMGRSAAPRIGQAHSNLKIRQSFETQIGTTQLDFALVYTCINPLDSPCLSASVVGFAFVLLLLRQLSPHIQVVEIQNRIEYERVTAHCLAAINRINREHYNVSFIQRYVNHCWMLGDLVASFHQA